VVIAGTHGNELPIHAVSSGSRAFSSRLSDHPANRPRHQLLTHDGYGHTSDADPSACVERATGEYLVDLVTPAPWTVCRSDRQPFDPGLGEPIP
jgi:TAP-like protein